jgi:hypothetical protein
MKDIPPNAWLDELHDDRDTVELDDACVVLHIESDDINPFDEYDCYGNAEIVHTRSDAYWWQPPRGDYAGPKRGTDGFLQMRQMVLDLLEYGTQYWWIEYQDAEGDEIDREGVGGIEPFPTDEYRRDLLSDLWAEIEYRAETRESRAATALTRAMVSA